MKKSELQHPYVLIVDDEISVAELISDIVRESGLNVQIVTRFELVAAALKDYSPAVVFLDMNLGDHSGTEVLDLMAAVNSKASVILMTGMDSSAMEPARVKAKRLRLTLESKLGKPFEIEDVEACLKAALKRTS